MLKPKEKTPLEYGKAEGSMLNFISLFYQSFKASRFQDFTEFKEFLISNKNNKY